MKKTFCLLLILVLFALTSCDTVIAGHRCIVYETVYAENDDYIVFPEVVYDKKNDIFYPTVTSDGKYYGMDDAVRIELSEDKYIIYSATKISTFSYDGTVIDEEKIQYESSGYDLIEQGFYSSYQRDDPDEEELSDIEKKIWEYAKTKSLKTEFPYHIEGNCKRGDPYIYFNVNVYDKVMWKGQALVNQGAKSATLNRIDENTGEIEELLSFPDSAIKCFNETYVFLYNRKNNSLDYYDLTTKEQKSLSKSDDWYFFYTTEKYVLKIDKENIPYEYEILIPDKGE